MSAYRKEASGRPGNAGRACKLSVLIGGLLFASFFFLKAVPGSPLRVPATDLGAAAHRTKNIEDIKPGDVVLARDENTGKVAPKKVLQAFRRTADHLRIVQIRSADSKIQELMTTNNHPFWVEGRGWVPAGELRVGQKVIQADRRLGTVFSTRYEPHPEGVAVFNCKVEDVHTYYVAQTSGDVPIWVHNADCQEWKVGEFKDLGEPGDGMHRHHVPQAHAAKQAIPGFNRNNAPAINVPKDLHQGMAGQNIKGPFHGNIRDVINNQIQNLGDRGAPADALDELLDLIKEKWPWIFK